ncbi:MAG: choice-of-anchor J domain-containing protein [Cytophagaceae bacterium]|nr:choice-of-anchor J domain-containing protein [Cytophagaceae bacterium]
MRKNFTLSMMLVLFAGISINAQDRAVSKKTLKSGTSVPAASITNSKANAFKRNTVKAAIASYDFEAGMPEGFNLINGDCGWAVGTDGGSTYFGIPAHDGQYAFVNDDVCNGDMSNVWMVLPRVDLSAYTNVSLLYDQYGAPQDVLTIKVSTDSLSWTDYPSPKESGWTTSQISLADFAGEDSVYIAFHYNDQGAWSYGWAVDNIVIQPTYTVTMTVTDGTDPIEGAGVVITDETDATTSYETDADGKLILNFADGTYNYVISAFAYHSKTGNFTVDGNEETVNEALTLRDVHTVTFNIVNINDTKLDATVLMKYQGNDMYQGTAINGKIVFEDVFEYEYIYTVECEGYKTVLDGELNVTGDKTVDVTMTEIMHHAPVLTDVTVDGGSAKLNWFSYATEPTPVKYFNDESGELTCFLQMGGNTGYGVIFDLEEYPYALLMGMEFMHGDYFGMPLPHVFDYAVHVVDVENNQKLYTSPTLQTTEIMIFEQAVFDEIDGYGGKKVGVFIEPKTVNFMGVAHPLIQADNVKTANHHSYKLNLTTLETELILTSDNTFSEFYIVLNILTPGGEKISIGGSKAMQHYEVLLDDVSKGTTGEETYTITGLVNGTYTAGVRSVYETGATATSLKEFTVTSAGIESVQSLLTCYVDGNGLLTVKADAQTVQLEVYSMSGQLVKTSSANSLRLPQRGIYAVKALIDGKPANFKVIW